jgi:hypothetical protein
MATPSKRMPLSPESEAVAAEADLDRSIEEILDKYQKKPQQPAFTPKIPTRYRARRLGVLAVPGIEEAHPSSPTIVAYEEGTLDPKSALHLRAHMLFCDTCAESYYLLKRMRAPSWMEVAIGMVQSAKDFLLEPLELGGMGEFLPAPAAVARGESPGTGAIEMLQHVSDAGEDADLRLFIEPNAGKQASASLRAALAPARPWTAALRDAHERELASIPLKAESQVLHPALQPESYVIQVFKDKGPIAECRLDIRICDEPAPAHRDH